MSTSALLSFLTAFRPPNPDPMTTTRCRRLSPETSGWTFMAWLLLSGDCIHLHNSRPDLQLSTLVGVIAHTRNVRCDAPGYQGQRPTSGRSASPRAVTTPGV